MQAVSQVKDSQSTPVAIHLAPMEGVVDPWIREILTSFGGISYCVTEFIRVTSNLNPAHVFYRFAPELKNQSRTKSKTPVFIQLLGSDLNCMAENAQFACELGAYGIDINFGCPAKTVNRHDGGSVVLKTPQRVYEITNAIRQAVPKSIPVNAKVRLGFEHKDFHIEIAQAAEAAGAGWLTVHARTKLEAYRPPAHWEFIGFMKDSVKIPVIANGDIWNVNDYLNCKAISGCNDVMIGRGIMADPFLALKIKEASQDKSLLREDLQKFIRNHGLSNFTQAEFFLVENYLKKYYQACENKEESFLAGRLKQLTKLLARNSSQFTKTFNEIKRLKKPSQIIAQCENCLSL